MRKSHNVAQETVRSEARDVEELHDLASHLPESERGRVQESVTAYVNTVVDEE